MTPGNILKKIKFKTEIEMKTGACSRIIRIILKLKIFNLKSLTPISEKKRVLFPEQKSELNGNLNVKIMYR